MPILLAMCYFGLLRNDVYFRTLYKAVDYIVIDNIS